MEERFVQQMKLMWHGFYVFLQKNIEKDWRKISYCHAFIEKQTTSAVKVNIAEGCSILVVYVCVFVFSCQGVCRCVSEAWPDIQREEEKGSRCLCAGTKIMSTQSTERAADERVPVLSP